MDAASTFPKGFAVSFSEFDRWDPASFQSVQWHWPKDVMAPIRSVLRPRKEKIDRSKFRFSDLQPVTIHFDGSIDRRQLNSDREYTMDLYFAQPGDIVVAKIDLKNGAVAIVPPGWKNVCVTSHFAVYEPDLTKLVPEYFHLLVQTNFFKQYLWRNKVGAEGRKEVKLDFFESINIPLPSIQTQKVITQHWDSLQIKAEKTNCRVAATLAEVNSRFFNALGLEPLAAESRRKYLSVPWGHFHRWSVRYNEVAIAIGKLARGSFPLVELGTVLELVQYGTSEKANFDISETPILRMNNIVDGYLDLTNLKYISLSDRERSRLVLQDGDILFNRTNSKELVGKCAVFHEKGEFVFASYLIRLRVVSDQASPDFVAHAINSPIGRVQIDALSRQIIGQANINTEELRSLQIPLPPLVIQVEIMNRIAASRLEIVHERENLTKLRYRTKKEIEQMILGIRPVNEPHHDI